MQQLITTDASKAQRQCSREEAQQILRALREEYNNTTPTIQALIRTLLLDLSAQR